MGIDLKCKRCGYEWEYTGNRHYASCPDCKTSVVARSLDDVGGSSADSISESEYSDLKEQVGAIADHLGHLEERIAAVEKAVVESGGQSQLEAEVVDEQIAELYETVDVLATNIAGEGSVVFEARDQSVYDPSKEFE